MRLVQQYLTKNDCYNTSRTALVPKGVMVHSTGANNPNVRRYVPGNDVIGYNTGNNDWNRSGITKCVHAFIGKFADGSIGTVQTLPWDMQGWHCAGSANRTHISFEICEDALTDKAYFAKVYQEAVELTSMLCTQYNLDPIKDGVVICHKEGYNRGLASNHGDVLHWFPKMGKSMDDFRQDVAKHMHKSEEDDEMLSYEQFKTYMQRYLTEQDLLPLADWATKEFTQAVVAGITDGTRPMAPATRAEVAIMVKRGKEDVKMEAE